jgi:hypothetical protein
MEEEKKSSANSVFNHPERCRKVLERIWDDPFAASFQEPVDTELYDDYLDIVEQPMSLRDVKRKLDAGGWMDG